MSFKKIALRAMIITLTLSMMLTMTGCEGNVDKVVDNWSSELQDRIAANQAEVDRLYQAGLISKDVGASLNKALANQVDRINQLDSKDLSKYTTQVAGIAAGEVTAEIEVLSRDLVEAIAVDMSSFEEFEKSLKLLDEANYNSVILNEKDDRAWNVLYEKSLSLGDKSTVQKGNIRVQRSGNTYLCAKVDELAKKEAGGVSGVGAKAVGLDVLSVDDKAIQNLMDYLDMEVYVLRKDPLGTNKEENSTASLDIIKAEIERAKKGEKSNIDKYFVNSGKKVWDTSKPENVLIRDTVSSGEYKANINGGECSGDVPLLDNVNRIGYDFIGVKTDTEKHDGEKCVHQRSIIEIRLKEFNHDTVSRLVGSDGLNKGVYVQVKNKCYLMEYPVTMIEGYESTNNDYKARYKESDMRVNILTNKILYSDGREATTENESGNRFKINGDSSTELGQASFIIDGVVGKETSFGYIPPGKTLKNKDSYGRIVLRDYLELSYMPEVVPGESFVALGRKVRMTKFKGTGDEQIGLFVDKSGNEIQNSERIKVTDIMDIKSGVDSKRFKLNVMSASGSAVTSKSAVTSSGLGTTSSSSGLGMSQNKLLNTELVSSIESTTRFPGNIVATSDKLERGQLGTSTTSGSATTTNDTVKDFAYGMAIDVDPFRSNLYSGWVDITGDGGDIGSLDWWNSWLGDTGYTYRIDRDNVLNFMMGNYQFEMRENGMLILDLDTLSKVQKEYNKQDVVNDISMIRTIFAILGIVVITYSIVILGAWTYDTNMVAGPRLMNIASFGRWEAISGTDELPTMDTKSKHYMTFQKTLKAAIVLIGVGSLIVFVDIIAIVDSLIVLFGQIAEVFINALQGI